ncbi:MAG: cobalt transporter CbiM [Desulfobacteraceae bacterium]|nr:cobalt transporter CbiM [Desulfobacteraceae bacterium]
MHISEGVLSGPVLGAGAALAAAGTAVGLKTLDYEKIAGAALLAAGFFVASLIHVPLGPGNVHLILNGIVGLLLGWGAFPALLVALLLQAVLFQYGGLTALGVNVLIMAVPGLVCYYLFRSMLWKSARLRIAAGFGCGFLGVLLAGLIAAAALVISEESFLEVAGLILAAHVPVMFIEGIVSASGVAFIHKVQPSLLPGGPPR